MGARFSLVRYGNVMGSRGPVLWFFMSIKDSGEFPIADPAMTRLMITPEQGVKLAWLALTDMVDGNV